MDNLPKPHTGETPKPRKRVYHSGYMKYKAEDVRRAAEAVAKALPLMMKQTGANFVAVTGKSGLSIAYAALMLIDFPLVTVRKDGERLQGSGVRIEGPDSLELDKYIVLDDLVASGSTVRNIVAALDYVPEWQGDQFEKPECVGVLCYYSQHCEDRVNTGHNYVPVRGTATFQWSNA